MRHSISTIYRILLAGIFTILFCQASLVPLSDPIERVRAYSRSVEFDYATWTLDALFLKGSQALLGLPGYISDGESKRLVMQYVDATRNKQESSSTIVQIYSDPNIADADKTAQPYKEKLEETSQLLNQISPLAESILQAQISTIISKLDLSLGGELIPSLEYHATPLPYALIVSPRDIIQQDANISLISDLTLDQIIKIEKDVSQGLNVSALVEEVGGIGTYPTMVQQSSDLTWITEVIAHEWIHNYLTLRPLGINYETNSELRTMNETTASIAGKEIGALVIQTYYPELAPEPVVTTQDTNQEKPKPETSETIFDFREAMHETRINVDEMLKAGEISEAEAYMEQRRQYIWENGYQIRKLNQAYFAFHGAYAESPGGAAGADPVGPAVRALRKESGSLAQFVNKISWMTSFDQLQKSIDPTDLGS